MMKKASTPTPTPTKATNDEEEYTLFLSSLTPVQQKGFEIAKRQLTCSFTLEKCHLFLQWKKAQQEKQQSS